MKKRLLSALLAVVMLFALAPAAFAATPDESECAQVLAALDIMVGDENGNLNLGNNVSRAEFAKLAVAASTSRDLVGDAVSVSPYPDVPMSHWAAPYIKAAVDLNLVKGNLRGYFEPDRTITLAEGVTIVLHLLGYQDSDFTGVWPSGQMAQYKALKLDAGITASQNSSMTRRDALYLIYNTLVAKNTAGVYYMNVLEPGTINAAGEVDRVVLINAAMDGPVVAEGSWQAKVPFSLTNATVYRAGKLTTLSELQAQDVVYWSKSMRTIWAYSNKATGTLQAISPSASSPTSVTVAGKSYGIETTTAAYDLSNLGTYQVGDSVTLLLGRDGTVAAVRGPGQATATIYGMVLAVTPSSYQDSNGNEYTTNSLLIQATDGNQYVYPHSENTMQAGYLVRVAPQGSSVEIKKLGETKLNGKVNDAYTKIGTYTLADTVEIMDTHGDTQAMKIYPNRLKGMTITSDMVRFYAMNTQGEISHLILKDATGDLYTYGVLTSVTQVDNDAYAMSSYMIDIAGTSINFTSASKNYNVSGGPCMIQGSYEKILNLDKVELDSFTGTSAISKNNKQYTVAEDAAGYLLQDRTYYYRSLASLEEGSYTLNGYYDKAESEGGRIRIIVAVAK